MSSSGGTKAPIRILDVKPRGFKITTRFCDDRGQCCCSALARSEGFLSLLLQLVVGVYVRFWERFRANGAGMFRLFALSAGIVDIGFAPRACGGIESTEQHSGGQ
jgi:hypothetical protein